MISMMCRQPRTVNCPPSARKPRSRRHPHPANKKTAKNRRITTMTTKKSTSKLRKPRVPRISLPLKRSKAAITTRNWKKWRKSNPKPTRKMRPNCRPPLQNGNNRRKNFTSHSRISSPSPRNRRKLCRSRRRRLPRRSRNKFRRRKIYMRNRISMSMGRTSRNQ